MRIIFFGTPEYVLPILKELKKSHEIVAVVTQNPKPAGRDKKVTYSEVDHFAHKKNIPVFYNCDNLPKSDMGICAAYGKIISSSVINHFKYGILNVHPSLLPKYRGASPIQTAIVNGDTQTGVTVIKMNEKMDEGPIVSSFKEEILESDTFETLRTRLFEKSSQFLTDLIPNYTKNKINLKKQDGKKATYTKIVSKQDGFVNLKRDNPKDIFNKFKGFNPWPGIFTNLQLTMNNPRPHGKNEQVEKRLKILKCHLENNELVLDEVQLEGKNPVAFKQFKEAYDFTF